MSEIFSMNSLLGKRILALIRDADYAHAGETEAIDLAFKSIVPDPKRRLLDVGIGRGGTAAYIHEQGFGQVSGLDLDAESVAYANKTYAPLEFQAGRAEECSSLFVGQTFDIIYLFNVFYALSADQQLKALKEFRKLSTPETFLILFDYTLPDGARNHRSHWTPIEMGTAEGLFSANRWQIKGFRDLTAEYTQWYADLVSRIESKKAEIIGLAENSAWYEYTYNSYASILTDLRANTLGGAIYFLQPSD